jgi:glucose-6-phosphate isomerase
MPNHRRRRWREAMSVRVDLNGLFAGTGAGVGAALLAAEHVEALAPELDRVRRELGERRAAGVLEFADLPYRRADVRSIVQAAESVRARFDTLVVVGIGGSALGAHALHQALGTGLGPRVIVSDSIDPGALRSLLGSVDLERTLFNVVSKSGDTVETMARFLIVRDRLMREFGAVDYKDHIVVTTEAERGSLRQIVNDEGFQSLVVPPDVDGRFSALTAVGLFPAAVAGIDLDELLAGAAMMDQRMRAAESPLADPALALAGALWSLARAGIHIVVLMSYAERLAAAGDWFCQLWGESLGKAVDRDGRVVEHGQTAVRARGSADQHSHLQLYLDGPRDKVVLFLRVDDHGEPLDIPAAYQDIEEIGCLGGNSLASLLNGSQHATELALARRGRPSATLTLPTVNPFTVGQLVYLLEMATVATGWLAGVDPFGQPAIEEAKELTFGLMGRPGFEERRAEIESWVAEKDPRFIL